MACSKLIIIELGCCSTRSDNLYFANNEQASLVVFTVAFSFVHAEYNLIKLKLYNNWSAQAVNNILYSAMWNSTKPIKLLTFKNYPANTSTLNQRWNDVDRQRSTTFFQRWQNNVETTLIELRWFNVDESTLFQSWNLVRNERWADICLSMSFQHWQNNIEKTLIELCWFNVDDPMLLQRCY